MGGYHHILSKYDLFLCLQLEKYEKSGFPKQLFLQESLESAEVTNKKHWKPTLYSLIAKHVLEMSVKLKFQCECFEKEQCFALMVLNWFPTGCPRKEPDV